MLRHLRLLALLAKISIQNEAAYRVDFYLRAVSSSLQLCGELLMLWTIFSNTRSVAGWGVFEMVILLGVFRVISALIGMVIAPNMRQLMEDIRSGTLDFVLTKPVSSQVYVSFRTLVFWQLTDVLLGMGLIVVGASQLAGVVSAGRAAAFVVMVACGAVIIYSVWLVLATSVFWFTRIANIEMVFWNVFEAGRYPVDIYRAPFRWILTYALPLAFLTTFPAAVLAGRAEPTSLLGAVGVAAAALTGATLFWRFGLRSYSGASA